jgi:hypothetical protein
MPTEPHYYFEYEHPRTGRTRRTRYRMTIAEAAQRHPGYRPLLFSAVVYTEVQGDPAGFKPYGDDPANFPKNVHLHMPKRES